MKRAILAVFVAAFVLAPHAAASIRGYQFAPSYRPETAKPAPPLVGNYTGIHTVAVLSGVGQHFELQDRGAGGIKTGNLDIAAWKIDERVEAIVRNALKTRFRFAPSVGDRASLAALPAAAAQNARFADFVKTLPAQGVDAFVIVRPNAPGGLALQTVLHHDTILWTDFEIAVIDARSRAVIARATARVQPPNHSEANFPGLVVGKEFALDRSLNLSADQQEMLRLLTKDMLTVTLTETLAAIGLPGPAK